MCSPSSTEACRSTLFTLLFCAGISVSSSAVALPIEPGYDLFETSAGLYFFDPLPADPSNPPIAIELEGLPLLTFTDHDSSVYTGDQLGNTDTIVRRKETGPGVGDTGTIDIEIVALSLKSVEPIDLGSGLLDIVVGLDLSKSSTGEMTIRHTDPDDGTNAPEGTWDSFFDVFIQVDAFIAGTTTLVATFFDEKHFETFGNDWSHTLGDAIRIPGLTSNFFATGLAVHDAGDGTQHQTRTSVPEPGTATMLGLVLLGAAFVRGLRPAAR